MGAAFYIYSLTVFFLEGLSARHGFLLVPLHPGADKRPSCGGPIKKFFLSKSTATMGNDAVIHKEPGHTYCYEKRCIQCGHHPEGPCHCQNCQDEQLRIQQQQERERRDILYYTFPEPDEASMLSFHDLSVEDRIRLSHFCQKTPSS